MGPLTWIDIDPQRKIWTCWHEAAHAVAALYLHGKITDIVLKRHMHEGQELNMSVAWWIPNPKYSNIVCGAGAVIDRLYGYRFTDDPDEIAFKCSQDRSQLSKILLRNGKKADPRILERRFEQGFSKAKAILLKPPTAELVIDLRNWIHEEFLKGTSKLGEQEIDGFLEGWGLQQRWRNGFRRQPRANGF
ncbi:MAG TPA: hypothetical protein VGL56_15905 [Fimbriimonadaceae bacterium]